MTRDLLDVLRSGYDLLWRQRDLDAAVRGLDPDFEWIVPGHPEGEVRRGRDAVRAFFIEWLEPWEDYDITYDLRLVGAEKALAICVMRGRGRHSQAEVEMRFAQMWWFREGRPMRMVFYQDPAEALAAAGLRE